MCSPVVKKQAKHTFESPVVKELNYIMAMKQKTCFSDDK